MLRDTSEAKPIPVEWMHRKEALIMTYPLHGDPSDDIVVISTNPDRPASTAPLERTPDPLGGMTLCEIKTAYFLCGAATVVLFAFVVEMIFR